MRRVHLRMRVMRKSSTMMKTKRALDEEVLEEEGEEKLISKKTLEALDRGETACNNEDDTDSEVTIIL